MSGLLTHFSTSNLWDRTSSSLEAAAQSCTMQLPAHWMVGGAEGGGGGGGV